LDRHLQANNDIGFAFQPDCNGQLGGYLQWVLGLSVLWWRKGTWWRALWLFDFPFW
jgi:hypothetical protein